MSKHGEPQSQMGHSMTVTMPLPPIRTLLEDEEDGEDYSEVIEVLKQYIKSYKRVIASQSSDIKTLLLSLNTLKASIEDCVSAIKNISSTLASLTNSSNAATTRKTSYSPRFDPFSGTMDLDSPLRPPRKEPYLGPAIDNTATSNLDPLIDIGSKEGFKDTITSSIVKELSKKAYTIPDDKNPDISNTYSNSNQAVLLMLLRDSLSSGPRAAISRPIESKKEDVYNEFHALTFSTYRKGLLAFNAEFNSYLAKLTMAKIDIDPSLILNQYFKALESKFPSWVSRQKSSIRQARMLGLIASSLNIEYLIADILEESRNPAIEVYRAAYMANSSNSTPNSNSNPSKKGKNKKKGKKKASYNIKGQNYSAKSAEQASFMLGSYNLAIEEEEESNSSSNSSSSSDSDTQLAQLLALKGYKKRRDFKGKGLKTSSNNKAKYKDNQPRRRPRDPALYNMEIPSNSIRKEDYRPIIEDAIVSKAIEPQKHYKLRNSLAKGTTLEGIGPSSRGKRPHRPVEPLATAQAPYQSPYKTREPKPLTGTGDLPCVLREPVIEGNKVVEKAISSPTLKKPNIGQRDYYNLLNLAKLWHVRLGHIGLRLLKKTSSITKGLPDFDKIKEADFHYSSYDRGKAVRRVSKALIPNPPRVLDSIEGDTVKIRPRPYNRNPIVLLLVNRKSIPTIPLAPAPILAKPAKITPAVYRAAAYKAKRRKLAKARAAAGRAAAAKRCKNNAGKYTTNSGLTANKDNNNAYNRVYMPPADIEKKKGSSGNNNSVNSSTSNSADKGEDSGVRKRGKGASYYKDILLPIDTSTIKFIEDNIVLSQPTNNTALEGELVDLDLDLEGAISPDPSNLNTEKAISIEIGPSKLEPYKSSSNKPIFAPKPIEVIAPNQPITNEPLNNSDLILEGDKMQLDYYKLLAKTSSYILSFVYKARKRVISKDSTPTTYKQVLKLPRDKRSKWLEAITKEFIQLLELGVFKFLPSSLLPSNRKLITCQNVLKVKKDAKNRPIKYKSRLVARGFIQVEGLDYTITYASITSNKAIYKLLLKYSYNPSTPNIIKLSKALYSLKQSPREWQDKLKILLKSLGYLPLISDPGVFYNARTCYFIVTYIDDCLFIGPNIGYITDLKKQLNKVYTIEDLGPAAYFLGWLSRSLNRPTKSHLNAAKNLFKYLNSTKDYSICFSYNGNTVADLGPQLSNSSNTTTKLSRDFHSKEGPRPLTTTSTTIVDSRNSKGSSRTSIINSSLVPIGFSDSDFAGDKANSKSTYGYLYKLAGRPISWKTKRATTITLSTLEAETDGLIEAIREVQWIIGLFSELYRPIDHPITLYGDNQGSIIVANNPALYVRTKHTLLKFRYVREQVKAKIVTIIYFNTKSDSGQSSRPLLPIQTLLEDKEDSKDYSEVIEVLKQHIKSYKRDSVSAIKNISSTLASLTNSSNTVATTTGKTSYSSRFDPFSGTMDLDSPLYPPRKEPYLGPAINSAASNLDPPIDTGSKEGFKDTITSSIVKELFKKAYTIPDDRKLSRESNFEQQYSRPIKSKKEDVYNEFHALTFSTYKKGLSACNADFNGYLAKLTIAKIDIDPYLILNQNPAIEAYRAAYIANSSNSTPNSNSNPSKKGKNKKKGKKKTSYNIEGQNYSAKSAKQASFILGSYNLAIEEEEASNSNSDSSSSSNSNT
ncbi:hypothetical protein P8C59_003156 [Phyllachora maydis]|uniref:Reverse transcriptase Ty1/copia-type domain-containing protein n=1 Tax=Phyllachora maydis TaxID=1825666 RepID=A0AAD9MA24_9PEZI|nr:hypothetical protein P8C59_003156 [Phyllachora maydis]